MTVAAPAIPAPATGAPSPVGTLPANSRSLWPACESCAGRPAAAVCTFADGTDFHLCVGCLAPEYLVDVTPRPGFEAAVKIALKLQPAGTTLGSAMNAHTAGIPADEAGCLEWRRYATAEECEAAIVQAVQAQPAISATAEECVSCAGFHIQATTTSWVKP